MLKKKPITERLIWRANYSDRSALWEYDLQTGQEHLFKEIDMEKIVSFDLLKPMDDVEEAMMGSTDIQCKSMIYEGFPAILTMKIYHHGQQPFIHVDLPKPKRLIFARKKRITSGHDICNVVMREKDKDKLIQIPFPALAMDEKVMIVIGWQETIHGKNIQAINYIYPSGMIELGGEFKQNDAVYGEPPLSPQTRKMMQELADKGELNDDEIVKYDLNTNKQEKAK